MTVASGSTKVDGSTYLMSLSGTTPEVRDALAGSTGAPAGYEWQGRSADIVASGGNATACFVFYLRSKAS